MLGRWMQSFCRGRRFAYWGLMLVSGCSGGGANTADTGQQNTVTPKIVQSSSTDAVSEPVMPIVTSQPASSFTAASSQASVFFSSTQAQSSSSASNFSEVSLSSVSSAWVAVSSESTADWPENLQHYAKFLHRQLVEPVCSQCHIGSGAAAGSQLIFSETSVQDSAMALSQFALDAPSRLLNKVVGFNNHGGGAVLSQNQPLYNALEEFVRLTSPDFESTQQKLTGIKEPRAKTLRRAALILTGRLPSRDELDRAVRSDEELAKVLTELMRGDGFREFLMRAANDQLLTDAFINGKFFDISNGFAPYYPIGSNKRFYAYESGDIWPFEHWNHDVYHGMVKGPLNLIAHTVMNDLPYTNVVTADYTLGNQSMAEYFRQDLSFDSSDKQSVKPMKNHGQILLQDGHKDFLNPNIGLRIDQHGQWVDYPHAGILNEPAFLARYPSSDTNRNRLRAKMVYRLFLGVDIESIAARTLTPSDLQDVDNPTFNNQACSVCHETLDPVAGAFQNYGVEGWYRSSWHGKDALPGSYKHDSESPYQEGDVWYRDMRAPGFEGLVFTNEQASLRELGQAIIGDDRFSIAAVKFWWPAIMSDALLDEPSEFAVDSDKSLYLMQQQFVLELAKQFREGFGHGAPYQLKDLLSAMIMSDWFRLNTLDTSESDALVSIAGVRLLTPEELENKVRALIGFAWGEREDFWANNGFWSYLDDQYRVYYGGIDSLGVTERAKAQNTLMAQVAESQALNLACASVLLDVNRNEQDRRLLRNQMRYISPFSVDWQKLDVDEPQAVTLSIHGQAGENRIRISHLNAERIGPIVLGGLKVRTTDGQLVFEVKHGDMFFSDVDGRKTGLRVNDMVIVERGFIELVFELDDGRDILLDMEVLTPITWPEPAELVVDLTATTASDGLGERLIRQQLVELFALTQGIDYLPNDEEITKALDVFISVWQSLEMQSSPMTLAQHNHNYCDLSVKGLPNMNALNTSDPQRLLATWTHLFIYFFTDFYFLHE